METQKNSLRLGILSLPIPQLEELKKGRGGNRVPVQTGERVTPTLSLSSLLLCSPSIQM